MCTSSLQSTQFFALSIFTKMKTKFLIVWILTFLILLLSGQLMSQTIEENWESGDFSNLLWERPSAQYQWEITSEGAHNGRYCARSGNYYTSNTESVLRLPIFLTESGNISYFRKVFSSPNNGVFRFYLDGQLRDSLSGYVDWSEFQCPISSGFHILQFCYSKNSAACKGSDCVWLDDIHLPNGIMMAGTNEPCGVPNAPEVEINGNQVLLSWDTTYHSEEILLFDDFEGHTYGTINSPGIVGWNYIDGDGVPTSSFGSLNFLNEGAAMAFIVLDDEMIYGSVSPIAAHSGHKFLGCPFHSNIDNDDWIVSPELDFSEPFTFSFFARSFSTQYSHEKFVVYYSITDNHSADFIPLRCDTITTTTEWTEYSFLIPAQAKYVALRCISHDQYILCLDDISIRGVRSSGHLCNVYRDGTLIASQIADSTFIDINAVEGNHCYTITYDCNQTQESDPSAEVCVNVESSETSHLNALDTINGRDILPADYYLMSKDIDSSHMASTLSEMLRWNKYPTYPVYTQLLQYFQDNFPNLCQIDTILAVTPHEELPHSIFGIHISNTLGQSTTKPAFLYSSSMHGSEVVGFYMMLHFADYILNNATNDSAVQQLLNNVDLYICPLENPDGTYHQSNDLIWQGSYSTYHNYNDVNLNRNYPLLPGLTETVNIQPETQAMIDWVTPIHFVMSVNFHCGAELLNYPWDSWTTTQRPHADTDWFRYICQNYATLCHAQDSTYLYGSQGRAVIDGGDWYVARGTRQDYMTYYQHCREVTMEISTTHVVKDTVELPTYWTNSKDALISYAMESSYGFWGTVTDAITHEPVEAMIRVIDHDIFHSEVYSHLPLGAYHRPIMAGTYTVEVSAPCYQTATFTITTRPGTGIRHDVELHPQVVAPVVFSQYILPGMQTTMVALSQNEVFWYDSDTASQAIATGSYYTTPVLFDTTTYYLEERYQEDSLLCISPRSSVTVYVLSNNDIPAYDKSFELNVYPNPTDNIINVEWENRDELPITEIHLCDAYGKLLDIVETVCTPSLQTARIDLSHYAKGIYFVKALSNEQTVATRKVVRE